MKAVPSTGGRTRQASNGYNVREAPMTVVSGKVLPLSLLVIAGDKHAAQQALCSTSNVTRSKTCSENSKTGVVFTLDTLRPHLFLKHMHSSGRHLLALISES